MWNTKKQCETPWNSVKHHEAVWNSHRHRHFWFPAVVKNIWHFFTPPFITFSTRIFTPVGKSLHQQCLYRLYLFASLIMATNGCFGHSGQSKVSETGLKWLPIPKNPGIDTKIKSVVLYKVKLWFRGGGARHHFGPEWLFWPLRSVWGIWNSSQMISHAQKHGDRHQNQVSSMFRTKVRYLTILTGRNGQKWPKNGNLASQVDLRCLKMVAMNFSCPKTWG